MKNQFYILKENRIAPLILDKKEEDEPEFTTFKNNETLIFYLFVQSLGSVTKMLKIAQTLSPELQKQIPSRATIYNLIKKHDWKTKIKEIKTAFEQDEEEYGSMSYPVINKIAGVIQSMYLKKILEKAKKGDYEGISHQEFKMIWEIIRTERGLATRVNANSMDFYNYKKMLEKRFSNLGQDSTMNIQLLVKYLVALPEEYSRAIINILCGKSPDEPYNNDGIPKILRR